MRRWESGWVMGLALVLLGFAAGQVVAEKASLRFKEASLYTVMQKVHAQTGANIAFVCDTKETARSFDLPVSEREDMVLAAAAPYGKWPCKVQSVSVLRTGLEKAPEEIASSAKIQEAMRAWLQTETQGLAGINRFEKDARLLARDTVQGVPFGTRRFGDLTPDEQQRVLKAARLRYFSFLSGYLGILIQ